MAQQPEIDLSQIKMLVLDVDGVMTNGSVIVHPDGGESKVFNLHDGHGIKMWHRAGLITALISGRESVATTVRAEQLSIERVMQGRKKKLPAFESLLKDTALSAGQVAYVGDDLLDLPLVKRACLGVAVANAVDELKEHADYITAAPGGGGAVREVIEYILKNTGKWEGLCQRYMV